MKKQVFVIHGGDAFDSYEDYLDFLEKEVSFESLDDLRKKGWEDGLAENLGEGFEVIKPMMPNKMNAKYFEWKIFFEKLLPFLTPDAILVGHSLGGIFLAKYLAENNLDLELGSVFLVAAPFNAVYEGESLADFVLPDDLSGFDRQAESIYLYHSQDDPVVPFEEMEKYVENLPRVEKRVFEDRGHFNQEEFPELVEDIKKSVGCSKSEDC